MRPAILLVDSEEVVGANDAWAHLERRDKWARLDGPAHLMVVCMEAWLLADQEAARRHFGSGFGDAKIPKWPMLEQAGKQALYDALEKATTDTKKGAYDKVRDSFKILAQVDPTKLEACCPHAKRLFEELRTRFASSTT